MAKILVLVALGVLLCGTAATALAAASPDQESPVPVTTVIPDDETTTTTTEQTTTSTTTPKTTSTSTTTTTTEKTTTTTSTTTTPVPPSPAPTPVPVPTANHWAIKNDTKFCLLVDMAVQVNLTYKTTDSEWKFALFDLPDAKNMSVDGHCTANSSDLMLKWGNDTAGGFFGLLFQLNETRKQYDMHFEFMLAVAEEQFPGAAPQQIAIKSSNEAPMTPQGMSYHCNRQQVFNATEVVDGDQEKKLKVQVLLSKTQWQAFHDRANEGYDLAKDCDAIDTPDIVPIAVGCALAGLVVIVLLGYLVGRRRSANRGGYLSM